MQRILKNLNEFYPKLKKIGKNGLYEKLGPLLVGVELEKSRYENSYSPYFIITGLWGNDISNYRGVNPKSCLDSPDIHIRLKNTDGLHFPINNENSQTVIKDISTFINSNFFMLDKNIQMESLIKIIDSYKSHPNIIGGSSGAMAVLLEFKFLLSIVLDKNDLKVSTINEISKAKDDWNMEHFKMWIGEYEEWFESLKKITKNDVKQSISKVTNSSIFLNLNSFQII